MKIETIDDLPEKWNDIPIIDDLFKMAIDYGFTKLKPFSDDIFLKELHKELRLSLAMNAKNDERITVSGANCCYNVKCILRRWFEEGKINKPRGYRNVEENNTSEGTLDILSVCLWKLIMRRCVGTENIGHII